MITHDFAKKAKLKSIPAEYYLQVVGKGWELVKDVIYEFNLVKKSGDKVRAWGYGIDVITDPVEPTDLGEVKALFPHIPEEAFVSLDKIPMDILVGMNFFGLHPGGGEGEDQVDHLRAL